MKGSAVKIMEVRVSELKTDSRVNRPIDKKFVAELLRDWDSRWIGIPCVSPAESGGYVKIDGMHRLEALRRMHPDDDPLIRVEVIQTTSVAEQAGLFLGFNDRLPIRSRGAR